MEYKDSLYNTLISKLNFTRIEYEKAIRIINEKGLIHMKNINPINYLSEGLYNIKEYSKKYDYNFFQDENYSKFVIVAYIEGIIDELSGCLGNMLKFSEANFIERIKHKKLLDQTFDLYTTNLISLQLFDIEFFIEYLNMMIQTEGYFDYFLPGMYYKYLAIVTNEMKQIGIDITKDETYPLLLANIEDKEASLEYNKDSINTEDYYKMLNTMSNKYRVDFISLDKYYSYEKVYEDGNKERTIK